MQRQALRRFTTVLSTVFLLQFILLIDGSDLPAQRDALPRADSIARSDTSSRFTMFVIGDAGKAGKILDDNAAALEIEAARLRNAGTPVKSIVFVGDNFYPVGLNHGEEVRKDLVNDVLGPIAFFLRSLGRSNVHAIPGNHDYYCDMFGPAPYGKCESGNLYEMMIPVWTYHLAPTSIRYATEKGSKDSVELILINSAYFMINSREYWHNHTDSLRRLINNSAKNPNIKWRMIFSHHPPYTFGEHGGYRVWDSRVQRVRFLGNCIEDRKDPIKYIQMWAGYAEDNCAPRYYYYKDTILQMISSSGAPVHAFISGHDHSLQLLAQRGGLDNAPKVFIITGAGAKVSAVRTPFIDRRRGFQYYAHPKNTPDDQGESIHGFLGVQTEGDMLKFWFINGETKKVADMGGASYFWVDRSGRLVRTE